MLNQVVMIGKLKNLEENKMTLHMVSDGFDIDVHLEGNLYHHIADIAAIDSMIGIKGKLCANSEHELSLYADKVTVLQPEKVNQEKVTQKKKHKEYER